MIANIFSVLIFLEFNALFIAYAYYILNKRKKATKTLNRKEMNKNVKRKK